MDLKMKQRLSKAIMLGMVLSTMTFATAYAEETSNTAVEPIVINTQNEDEEYGIMPLLTEGTVESEHSLAIGEGSKVHGTASVAIGWGATAENDSGSSVAIGSGAKVSNADCAVAIGFMAKAVDLGGIAIGAQAQADRYAIAMLGEATDHYAMAFGDESVADSWGAIAFGYNAHANHDYSVAIGSSSQTGDIHTVVGNWNSTTIAGTTGVLGTVSFGTSGKLRQLQNVAAGMVSASSTDAVNGSQLNAAYVGIESLKTALETAKNELNSTITSTKNELNSTIASTKNELNSTITSTKTELNSTITSTKNELNSTITSTKTELNNRINMVDDRISNSNTRIESNANIINNINGILGTSGKQTTSTIDSSITNTTTVTTNPNAKDSNIGALVTTQGGSGLIDLAETNEANISILDGNIKNVNTALQDTQEAVAKDIENLQAKDSELDSKIDSTKKELSDKIDSTKSELNGTIDSTKKELSDKIDSTKSELNGTIDSTKKELGDKIDSNKQDLQAQINTNKTELEALQNSVGEDIKTVTENVTTNTTNIEQNTQRITNLESNVTNNTYRINSLDNRLNKVGAGAAALAALHPLDYDADTKFSMAAGVGNYRGTQAGSVGAFYRPNENIMLSLGSTFGNGEDLVNFGLSFAVGKGVGPYRSKATLAKNVAFLQEQNEHLKDHILYQNTRIADQDSRITEQEERIAEQDAKIATLMAKLEELLAEK